MSELKEIGERLTRLARTISRVAGIDVGVEPQGNRLIFVDYDGEPIRADGDEIIAATLEEITAQTFLNDFAVRAFRAAMVAKYQEIVTARTP